MIVRLLNTNFLKRILQCEKSTEYNLVSDQTWSLSAEDGGGGEWYRSRVVFVDKREELPPEKRDVEVAFVDFGKTTHVKLSETRKLKQEFLHLPFQVSTTEN